MDGSGSLLKIVCFNFLLGLCLSYECAIRYELKEEIKESIPHLKNCTAVKSLYPVCNRSVTVYYAELAPYVAIDSDLSKEPFGLVPDMLRNAVDACCFGCTDIEYIGQNQSTDKFTEDGWNIYMPLGGTTNADLFYKYEYVPMIAVRQVSFLAKDGSNKADEYTEHLMQSVSATWPLFITALLMALASGCVIWILDSWFNQEEFPEKFPKGPFEGFWWAFVSMTTVGYGDKAPRSWFARMYSIIWILIGITVFSMYTSILTSALNVKANSFATTKFEHKKVGVLNFTAAGIGAAVEENAKIVKLDSVDALTNALKEGSISAMALDNVIIQLNYDHFHKEIPDIRKHHSVKPESKWYGVLSKDKDLTLLLRSFLKTNGDIRHALATYAFNKYWPDLKLPADNEVVTVSFLNHRSRMFTLTVVGLIVVVVICSFIGLTCKFIFNKNPKLKKSYIDMMKLKYVRKKQRREDLTIANLATIASTDLPPSTESDEACLCLKCGFKCTGISTFQRHLSVKHEVFFENKTDLEASATPDENAVNDLLAELEAIKLKWETKLAAVKPNDTNPAQPTQNHTF